MTLEPAFGHWLAGFVDGEGCFYLKKTDGQYLICAFRVALRLDDRAILEEIQRETGIGQIHVTRRAKWGSNDQASWSVTRKREVMELARIFDLYPLRSKKARDFVIWRQAVTVWGDKERCSNARVDTPRLWELKAALEGGRVYQAEVAA